MAEAATGFQDSRAEMSRCMRIFVYMPSNRDRLMVVGEKLIHSSKETRR